MGILLHHRIKEHLTSYLYSQTKMPRGDTCRIQAKAIAEIGKESLDDWHLYISLSSYPELKESKNELPQLIARLSEAYLSGNLDRTKALHLWKFVNEHPQYRYILDAQHKTRSVVQMRSCCKPVFLSFVFKREYHF